MPLRRQVRALVAQWREALAQVLRKQELLPRAWRFPRSAPPEREQMWERTKSPFGLVQVVRILPRRQELKIP